MTSDRETARKALEQVCSRKDFGLAPECYAEDFADHVNGLEFYGLDGVRRSTELYQALFEDVAIEVVDQVAEKIASPVAGSCAVRTEVAMSS